MRSWVGGLLRRWADRIAHEGRWLWAEVRWLTKTFGYWIRPYDMLADARRWRWQPRQRCGWSYARGGVIRGPSDPSDDSIPFMLSPGRVITDPDEAEALGLTVEARRMRERGERCPQCGTAPASLIGETDHTRLFGCHVCNETWALPAGERS